MNVEKMEDWLSGIPSKLTRKSYRAGVKKFEEWFNKPIEDLLTMTDQECGRVVEKFFVILKQNHPQNTCRNVTNAVIQYLKFHGKNPKYRRALQIYRSVPTTRDHRAHISEIQEMAKVSDLKEQVMLEVGLLGLRIGDSAVLEWQTFDVNGDCPIPIEIMTKKESVVARSFVSSEFKGLLDKYLNTIDKNNKYLFQSARNGHLTVRQIEHIFNKIKARAGIVNHGGLFRWHCLRKLVLRTCAELGISSWSAKMLVGKSIQASDSTYLEGTELRNDFIKLNKVLRLFPEPTVSISSEKEMLDAILETLKALLAERLGIKKLTTTQIQVMYENLLPEDKKPIKVKLT